MPESGVAALLYADVEAMGTPERLVVAALKAFSSWGYDGVSMREVERECGVNRGLSTYHFGSKEGLWRACVDLLMARFHDEMTKYRPVLRIVTPAERGRLLLTTYISFASKHPEFFRLLIVSGGDSSTRTEWIVKGLRETIDFFNEVTGTTQTSTPESEAIACYGFLGAASMIFAVPDQCRLLFGVDPLEEGFINTFTDTIASLGFYGPGSLGGAA